MVLLSGSLGFVVMNSGDRSFPSKFLDIVLNRRWIINRMIAGGMQSRTLDEVLKGDSMLVEAIAGVTTPMQLFITCLALSQNALSTEK